MNKQKPQIVIIHGGDSFATNEAFYTALRRWTYDPYKPERKRWRDALVGNLVHSHEFIIPDMPCKQNADYTAWSIWFGKMVPYFRNGVILVGHSLGGAFLLRYLTENKLPVTIAQLHLIAPVIDNVDCKDIGGFKIDVAIWPGFAGSIESVHLWHSTDDMYVPIHHSERFQAVYPAATLHRFTNRGHFLTESFPELELVIKSPH